jgi:hypothetical protein
VPPDHGACQQLVCETEPCVSFGRFWYGQPVMPYTAVPVMPYTAVVVLVSSTSNPIPSVRGIDVYCTKNRCGCQLEEDLRSHQAKAAGY